MRWLVVSEKEQAGEKIAKALNCSQYTLEGITYWENEDYIVVPARGHLLKVWLTGLNTRIDRIKLPLFDYYWRETEQKRLLVMAELFKECDDVIVASVDWDENILLLGKNGIEQWRVGEFIDKVLAGEVSFKDYKVLSMDKSGKIVFAEIKGVSRHLINEPLYKITLSYGRTVRVTSSHSVFVVEKGKIKLKRGDEIQEGDLLLIPRYIPENPQTIIIDLLDELLKRGFESKIYIYSNKMVEILKQKLVEKRGSNTEWILEHQWRGSRKSYAHNYKALEWLLQEGIDVRLLDDAYLVPIHHRNHAIKRYIKVDEKLCALLGYYLAEGSLNKTKKGVYAVRFHFGKTETERQYAEEVCKLIKDVFGIDVKVYRDKRGCYHVIVRNALIYFLFAKVFGLEGKNATTKEIPNFMYNVDSKCRRAFIDAYIKGDGTVKSDMVTIATSSKRMAEGLVNLLLQDGIIASISVISGKHPNQSPSYRITFYSSGKNRAKKVYGGFILAKVKKVEIVEPTTEYVYDFSTETESFVCGLGGVLCHNTDWDREGEVIGERIYAFLKNKLSSYHLPMRAYMPSLTAKDIANAFSNLRRMDETLLTQGIARNIADAIIGLNLTKAVTKVFKVELGYEDISIAISMGRVRNPVLTYIVKGTKTNVRLKPREGLELEYGNKIVYIETPIGLIKAPQEFRNYDYCELVRYEKEEEEEEQSEELPDTYRVQRDLPFDPDYTINLLEQMYLNELITYPRTESTHAPEHVLIELEELFRKNNLLQSDNFSYRYCPHGTPEGDKLPILPTEIGIEHYMKNKLSLAEKVVMNYLIERVNRAFAPPLRIERKIAVFKADNIEFRKTWCVDVKNKEDVINTVDIEIREEIPLGKYRIVKFEMEKYKTKTIFAGSRFSVSKLDAKNVVRWMVRNQLGTDATRHEYVTELKKCRYIDEELMPTRLGMKITGLIEHIRLGDASLTAEMERKIRNLRVLDDLKAFEGWLKEITVELIHAVEGYDSDMLRFTCPHGHLAMLNARRDNRTGEKTIWLYCSACGKSYPI